MAGRNKYGTSQLLNFATDSYLERTSRPIYAIVFLLPFIIFYELGTIFINTDVLNQSQVRVVAFVWLQKALEYIGFGSKLTWVAPPLAVVVILIALQVASGKKWYFSLRDLVPMAIECILLAVPLIVFSLFLNASTERPNDTGRFNNKTVSMQLQDEPPFNHYVAGASSLSMAAENGGGEVKNQSLLANIITGIGAGIYEELIFRLILICVLMIIFQDVFRLSHKQSIVFSVIVSAALFSAHHHIVFLDGQLAVREPFNWAEFGFRTVAGVYFAVIFAIRGFGITAGTHGFYDILATVINAVFFTQ
jgi:membrane protease YdiL (CAAX protease family)